MVTNISIHIIKEITKFRLTLSVVFSSFISYLLGAAEVNYIQLFYLISGGILIVSSSNIFNQIIERDLDKLMKRTQNRPLPKNKITTRTALFLAISSSVIGLIFMYLINIKVAILAALSIFLYTAVYTPMKLISPFSVFVGAIPGAFPFMIGWVAATNHIGIEALTLFLMQFFWQFPHFWALAWKLDEDYKKAGFRLLPSGERNKKSAFQIMLYSAFLVPVAMLPWAADISGTWSMVAGVLLSLFMYYPAVKLYFTLEEKHAKQLMMMSFIYLPVLFSFYCFNLT